MAKIRLTGATFDASEKTIVHASFSDVTLAGIQLIVNVTDQIIIYNFADTTKGGTLATDTLTLEYDTTSMSDTDELMILVEDGGAANVLPTGASTSAKQDTQITSLDAIKTAVEIIDNAIAGNEMQVDIVSSALPSGASTSAKQDTVIGHLDGVETLLTAIDGRVDGLETSNSAIQTAVELIDDAIKVLGTDTYTEATSKGMVMGAVRRDADTPLANTTNEFSPLITDANGYLKVEIFDGGGSHTVDNNGTFAVQVDGAALTALQLIDDAIYTDDTSTHATGTSKGVLFMAAAAPTDTAVNANDIGAVGMTVNRELYVSLITALPAGTNGIGKLTANSGVDIGDVDITSIIAGTGATNLGKARDSAIGATDTGVAMLGVRRDTPTAETPAAGDYVVPQYSANGEAWVRMQGEIADDAAFTVGTTRVLPVGLLADESSTDSVDEGDVGIARMTLDRKAIGTLYPSSTSGDACTIFRSIDLDETEEEIKATAGNIYGYYFANTNAAARYLKFYNATAANVTVGSTTPVMTLYLPPTSAGHISFPYPVGFSTAITAAATTGVADSDTGAPGANEVIVNVWYK